MPGAVLPRPSGKPTGIAYTLNQAAENVGFTTAMILGPFAWFFRPVTAVLSLPWRLEQGKPVLIPRQEYRMRAEGVGYGPTFTHWGPVIGDWLALAALVALGGFVWTVRRGR